MKNVFLFPGQGSQFCKMGQDFYDNFEEARKVYDLANEVTNMNIKEICFEATDEELKKTQNAQLCIAAMSLAVLEVINKKGIKAEYAAGLSLGEYVGLVYGGFLSMEDCFKLLKMRGYFMENLIPNEEYSMAAIIGLDSKEIEKVCEDIRKEGEFVVPANYNYSAQTVISGNKEAVAKAMEALKAKGAKRAIELNTSGPFHTEKLEEARKEYVKELKKVTFGNGNEVKVIKNLDGKLYTKSDDFVDILSKHIVSPVRFDKALSIFAENNIDNFIEIGPGKSMTGFVKKEIKETKCYSIDTVEKLNELLGGL